MLDADTLEEKVFLMQVFFERLIIPRFRMIARSSRGTMLEDLCNRLTIDDGIHHGAGMAYERVLLEHAGKKVKTSLVQAANRLLPVFAQHALWRPKAREFIGALMRETDIRMLREDLEQGIRLAKSLGIDVSDIELPPELGLEALSAVREDERGVAPELRARPRRGRPASPSDSKSPGCGGSSSWMRPVAITASSRRSSYS